jgi:hypothetical protein
MARAITFNGKDISINFDDFWEALDPDSQMDFVRRFSCSAGAMEVFTEKLLNDFASPEYERELMAARRMILEKAGLIETQYMKSLIVDARMNKDIAQKTIAAFHETGNVLQEWLANWEQMEGIHKASIRHESARELRRKISKISQTYLNSLDIDFPTVEEIERLKAIAESNDASR